MKPGPIETSKQVQAEFLAAPSKSVTHRALVVAALATGDSVIHDPLDAADTRVTRDGLIQLGIPIDSDDDRWTVRGRGGRIAGGGSLALRESGTSYRFLLAVAAMGESPSFLDGAPRLRERPVRELSRALERLGGVVSPVDEGPLDLPLRAGGTVLHGGSANLAADRSSQFASALLLMGSRLPGGLELRLDPPAVSLPYVDLTVEVLKAFGVQVVREAPLRWRVAEGSHRGCHYRVEGDHSSASYLLAAPAIVGGRTLVRGLRPGSAQPDSRLSEILMDCGCQVNSGEDWIEVRGDGRIMSLDLELGEAPDLVPTVAVLALFADGPSVLRGIAHLRHKESDRLGLLARNLRALGRPARAFEDRLEIGPRAGELRGAAIRTASDHRIAMAFAIAGLRIPGIELDDADCVGKSNPEFWSQFRAFYG